MQQYPAGDGWGPNGLEITDVGRVYRFAKPVTEIWIKVESQTDTVFVGFNEDITGAVENTITGAPADERHRVAAITAAEALAKGVPVAGGEDIRIVCPIDPTHGRRGVYCVWFITAAGTASVVDGGVVGM